MICWRRANALGLRLRKYSRNSSSGKGTNSDSPLKRLLNESSAFGESEPAAQELRWATQPYAAESPAAAAESESLAPRDATVLLFPGQGSQYVGMGERLRDVPAAKDLYDLASNILGWDVWGVCTRGPAGELDARCQPCVTVTALAALEAAREARPAALARARAAAGYSVGEFAALVFAGALSLEAALQVLEVRAAAMRAAAEARAGGLLTVWLAPDADVPRLLERGRDAARAAGVPDPACDVAIYVAPGCKVVGGDEAALAAVARAGRAAGVRRAAWVPGCGAWHTALMRPAEAAVAAALGAAGVRAPRLPVVSCASGRPLRSADAVRRALTRLAATPVCWEQTLHALYARPRGTDLPLTLALGPGRALRSSLKQVNARAWDSSLQIEV